MDKIKFACVCGKSVSAPAEFAGRKAKCPQCGQVVRIPQAAGPEQAGLRPLEQSFQNRDLLPPAVAAVNPGPLSAGGIDPLAPAFQSPGTAAADDGWPEIPPAAAGTCPLCAAPIASGSNFCAACGHNVSDVSPAASLPSLAGGGASLAQSARSKQLNIARRIMFAVGILTIVVNLAQFGMVNSIVDGQFDAEAQKLKMQGMIINQQKFVALKDAAKRSVRVAAILLIGLGAVYIAFGFLINKYPVPVTITGLVLYVGTAIVFALLDPEYILRSLIFKGIVTIALVKAVQAAVASQRQSNREQQAAFTS
jgi:hypothetical protein